MLPERIISHLNLVPHIEGGYFREVWTAPAERGERPIGSLIYYMLTHGDVSHWHKHDASETWLFHAGAPMALSVADSEHGPVDRTTLGTGFHLGHKPSLTVPQGSWQSARTTGDWSLVSCLVAPAFRYEGFTVAPKDFPIPS
ncbi:cupin [Meridianimarinicoccus roseus]|jgi:hypothetical protein|uniref:Cupin n=1 Tax=Meridianimarinicoccus roseus TaxID=2072018 RepID=A0A2V2LG37_9RHOB|nr:cupin domain-containing protein [Meridianimarinicoccus roseus]PWR00893.1 cupin [Meridianimarinicoccus roseus]